MNVYFKKTEIGDARFLHSLITADEYETLFYENKTTIRDWEERIPYLIEFRGDDNYIICDTMSGTNLGWIMYEIVNERICKLHIIALRNDLLGNKYGFFSLNRMRENLSNNVNKISLDVQQVNIRAISVYKRYGFVIVGEEAQEVGENKTENYFKMEYVINIG